MGIGALVGLTACSTAQGTEIILQQNNGNVFLQYSAIPYTIEDVVETEIVANPSVIEKAYTASRTGISWLLGKVSSGTPASLATTYRITKDQDGNILSKVKLPGTEVLIESTPAVFQYGAKVVNGSYFYASRISRYGFDCVGCGVEAGNTATMASLLKVSATAVRQSDGSWKNGITYDGYYMVAADKAFPLCTVLEISDHHLSGSGIREGVPFKALVVDRGGAITQNRLDFFIGTETFLDTVIHNDKSKGTKVTVVGFLKWKRNSLGQMTCTK
jgi:3D (Asp-Asp-Asp) domain-containing protein